MNVFRFTILSILALVLSGGAMAGMVLMGVRLVRGQPIQLTCMSNEHQLNRSVECYITGRDPATRRQDTDDLNGVRNPKTSLCEGGDT